MPHNPINNPLAFSALFSLSTFAFSILTVQAQSTFDWTGADSASWDTASNWSPSAGAPPGTNSDDIARFNADVANSTISLSTDTTLSRVDFAAGATGYTLSGSKLTLSGSSGTFIQNESQTEQIFNNALALVSTGGVSMDVSSGSSLTFNSSIASTSGKNLVVTGGGIVNFNGRFSGYANINQLIAQNSTINYNTSSYNGASNYWAQSGGRINLLRNPATGGIKLTVGDTGGIFLSTAGMSVGTAVRLLGDESGGTTTFGADFAGTGTASHSGNVSLNYSGAAANNTFRLYAAEENTLDLYGSISDSNAPATGTKVEITGGGVIRFVGSDANTSVTPILISDGTLELVKDEGVNAIAGGSVTVEANGTLRLAASLQIADTTTMVLNGGAFSVGTHTDTLDALTVTEAGGIIDFGGESGSITFAALGGIDGMLTINGWSESASIVFTDGSGWDSSALAKVTFTGYGAASFDSETGALAPIPEPAAGAAFVSITTMFLLVLCRRRKA